MGGVGGIEVSIFGGEPIRRDEVERRVEKLRNGKCFRTDKGVK